MKTKNSIVPLYANKHYGPDHHIWDNNGTWWAHFSLQRARGRAKRRIDPGRLRVDLPGRLP